MPDPYRCVSTVRSVGDLVNLAHMIDGHDADRVALISRNRETTYGQLRDQVIGMTSKKDLLSRLEALT